MKRFILPLILLFLVGAAFAVESEPSEVVGYFKLTAPSNSWSALAIPFGYGDLSVTSIIGDQLGDMDEIYDIATSVNTTYYDGSGWYGDLEEMEYGHVYWIKRDADNPTTEYFVLGKVNPNPVTVTVLGNSWTPFALNESADTLVESLFAGVAEDGDEIYDMTTSQNTTYYEGSGWYGDVEHISPTHGYWYVRNNASGFVWNYTPSRTNINPSGFEAKYLRK